MVSPEHILSHHHLDLVLDLGPHISRDVIGQLIGGALEGLDGLLELADHGVSCLLLSLLLVLHVALELLDVYGDEGEQKNQSSKYRIGFYVLPGI